MSCCRAASSLIALYFKRSRVRCLTIPVPMKCLSRNDAGQLLRGRWRRGNRQLKLLQRTKIVRVILSQPCLTWLPLVLRRFVDIFPYLWVYALLYFLHPLLIVDGPTLFPWFYFFWHKVYSEITWRICANFLLMKATASQSFAFLCRRDLIWYSMCLPISDRTWSRMTILSCLTLRVTFFFAAFFCKCFVFTSSSLNALTNFS